MITEIKVLFHNRELLWIWTLREIKVRYKQSILGIAWAILQPLSFMFIFTIIFTYFVTVPTGDIPYSIFSYSALLPWTFFANSIGFAVTSLVGNINLITKIYLPREIFPIASVIAALFDYLIASLLYIGLMIIYSIPVKVTLIIMPFLLLVQIFLTIGIVLFLSAVNVFYRDIRFVVPIVIQLWMYVSPIIYPLETIPTKFRSLYMLNPMATLIESYRNVTIRGIWPDWIYLGITTLIAFIVLLVGFLYFKRVEWQFADVI